VTPFDNSGSFLTFPIMPCLPHPLYLSCWKAKKRDAIWSTAFLFGKTRSRITVQVVETISISADMFQYHVL